MNWLFYVNNLIKYNENNNNKNKKKNSNYKSHFFL